MNIDGSMGSEVVAFNPEQVTHATEHKGTFNPKSKKIRDAARKTAQKRHGRTGKIMSQPQKPPSAAEQETIERGEAAVQALGPLLEILTRPGMKTCVPFARRNK